MQPLRQRIQAVRRDVGNLLFHFTRETQVQINGRWTPQAAERNLLQMMRAGVITGSAGYIRGGYNCVCFSEAPISEAAALFRLASLTADGAERPRYEPYCIAVTKEWLFAQGGRPAIYQTEAEYNLLPEELRYRHVRYEPANDIDHTWEREWRIKTDALELDADHTLMVVPTSREAFDMMYLHSDWEADFDRNGEAIDAYPNPRWMVVSLDFFGVIQGVR